MSKIYEIRNEKVMIDSDLADFFNMELKRLNEQVKRNIEKFTIQNRFQLTKDELSVLKSQFATSSLEHGGRRKSPFVFTKNGVEIASKILKKDIDLTYLFEEEQESELMIYQDNLRSKIHSIRGLQVMIDYDLASLYEVDTRRLREQVKRNPKRFPNDFMYQLNNDEINFMVSQNAIPSKQILGGTNPYVFSEQGIASLSSVLTSNKAIAVNIKIMRAFVEMRKNITKNEFLFRKIDDIEQKQIEFKITQNNKNKEVDASFDKIFDALEEKNKQPTQGIFFAGQIFDAYRFISNLVRKPQKNIVLIDNYIDDTVLTLFSKRSENVSVTIYTQYISKELKLDLQKHNAQYQPIKIKIMKDIHDRFLILDDNEIYHIGASLKDLGKKLFGFSIFDKTSFDLMNKLTTKKTEKYENGDDK